MEGFYEPGHEEPTHLEAIEEQLALAASQVDQPLTTVAYELEDDEFHRHTYWKFHQTLVNRLDITRSLDDQVVQTFVDGYAPVVSRNSRDSIWIPAAVQIALSQTPASAASLSLRAVAMTRVGHQFKVPALVAEGQSAYGRALSALQQSLYSSSQMTSPATIAACRFLASYEMFGDVKMAEPNLTWHTHQSGLESVLHAGALGNLEGLWNNELVQGVPDLMMRKALYSRRGPGPRKLRLFRDYCLRNNDIDTQVWVHGLKLASLLEKLDGSPMPESGSERMDWVLKILRQLLRLDQQLQTWYINFSIIRSKPVATENSLGNMLFVFDSLLTGQITLVHWTLRLILSSTVSRVIATHPEVMQARTSSQDLSFMLSGYTPSQRLELALNIMRSTPYFCQPTARATGVLKVSFSYDTAVRELKQHPNILSTVPWLQDLKTPLLFDKETLSPGIPAILPLANKSPCALHRLLKLYYGVIPTV